VTSTDIKMLLNRAMTEGYVYTTVKKIHQALNEYFRYLSEQELVAKNPMTGAPMIKKSNFMASQGKENLPTCETVTVFTEEEIEGFKKECFRCYENNGRRVYQQATAYLLMLNTGLRAGELLGLLNRDIDVENRVMHIRQGVKEIERRDGTAATSGREMKVGKLKSASSKRDVPLNSTALAMIEDLRKERYYSEDSPLVCDEKGNHTRPVNLRKRFHRIQDAAGIEQKGLHASDTPSPPIWSTA